jgi:predicted secreted protein
VSEDIKPARGYDMPGTAMWRFKAVGLGQTQVVLKEVRVGETDGPPAQLLTFTVIVG